MDQQSSAEPDKAKTEDELLELAKKELLQDTKCASIRAEQFGAHSWAKPQKYIPSKRFLRHMLCSASRENNRTHDRWKSNRTAKVTSAVIHPSEKYDHSKRERQSKHKHSRWENSPKHNTSPKRNSSKHKKSSSSHKNKTEKRHHHHHHHHHPARSKKRTK